MALIAVLDDSEEGSPASGRWLEAAYTVTAARSVEGLERLIRMRPAVAAVISLDSCVAPVGRSSVLDRLARAFPKLPVVVWAGPRPDPNGLLQLGRHPAARFCAVGPGFDGQLLVRALREAIGTGPGRIPVLLGRVAPRWAVAVLRRVVDTVEACWTVDQLASALGLRSQELNRRLREAGLPSAGRLLHWVRVFYAAWWTGEPGRTGATISRQLEYASSQSLVRAVRTLVGVTPGQLADLGGLDWAWLRFLADHPGLVTGLSQSPSRQKTTGTLSAGSATLYFPADVQLHSPAEVQLRRPA